MENWESRLTAFDWELLVMVSSLTGERCEPKKERGGYSFRVDYLGKSPDWVAAVMAAVEGRAGERFREFRDSPEESCFVARIAYAKNDVFQYGDERDKEAEDVSAGDVYCRHIEEIRAVCVKRTNLSQLQKFVGGGELRIPKGGGVATFHFLNGGVFLDVDENDYVCRGKYGFFKMPGDVFERTYEAK